jgi:hypothetical protein
LAASAKSGLRRRFAELIEKFAPGDEAGAKRGVGNGAVTASGGSSESTPDIAVNPLPTLAHPTFLRIARGDETLAFKRGRRSIAWVESDAPDGYLSFI